MIRSYHLRLKGYVGSKSFDPAEVDRCLDSMKNQQVDVLIDSTGGSVAAALSIFNAFRNHGNVHVHMSGLNASAATIASMGAARISIDAAAMYLVHKVSTPVAIFDALNADQIDSLIDECKKTKEDLVRLDQCVAVTYGIKCKKSQEDLLALMKSGGWMTPQEALQWGFVDEITHYDEDAPAHVDDAVAAAFMADGIPIPAVADADDHQKRERKDKSILRSFLDSLSAIFSSSRNYDPYLSPAPMDRISKSYDNMTAAAGHGASFSADADGFIAVSEKQADAIEAAIADKNNTIEALNKRIAELEKAPAKQTPAVISNKIEDSEQSPVDGKSDAEKYVNTYNKARELLSLIR